MKTALKDNDFIANIKKIQLDEKPSRNSKIAKDSMQKKSFHEIIYKDSRFFM